MSIKTVQIIQDDFDGSDGAQTVSFGWEGQQYEIDLNEGHAKQLHEALVPFIERARRARGRGVPGRRATPSPVSGRGRTSLSGKSFDAKTVRQWAHSNGVSVPDRGRVPESVIQEYEAALNGSSPSSEPVAKKQPAKKTTAKKAAAKTAGRRPAKKEAPAPVEA